MFWFNVLVSLSVTRGAANLPEIGPALAVLAKWNSAHPRVTDWDAVIPSADPLRNSRSQDGEDTRPQRPDRWGQTYGAIYLRKFAVREICCDARRIDVRGHRRITRLVTVDRQATVQQITLLDHKDFLYTWMAVQECVAKHIERWIPRVIKEPAGRSCLPIAPAASYERPVLTARPRTGTQLPNCDRHSADLSCLPVVQVHSSSVLCNKSGILSRGMCELCILLRQISVHCGGCAAVMNLYGSQPLPVSCGASMPHRRYHGETGVLQAPSRTVGFTRRFHTLSSIQATNTSLTVVPQSPVVVHTYVRSRTLRQAASVNDCRPLGCGSIYSVLGRHLESSPTRVMLRGGLRHQSVSPEHSCVVDKRIGNSSRREEVCDVSKARRYPHSQDSQKEKGADSHERIVPIRGEGEVGLRLLRGAAESAPAAAHNSMFTC
ncbi:hypothetical protein PR048_007324 [Dryococelus australis]|uniref:Uncharacterized protein n=1 Tax=Dryococelus australis TaxID=614101 RepID=A0ABQ9IDB7_9NEOP|nr:hypothetical protein PR048_007324 [Dryococelus australis]